MFQKVKRYIHNPYYALGYDLINRHPKWMSDKYYLSVLWKMVMGYEIDWKHPRTFNEKMQWLKLYDRNPLYTLLVDKYRVKQWVSDMIGEEYVIPTLAVYDSVEEIDLDKLPDQFVLKCNHDSGSVVICKDKSTFDLKAAKQKLNSALKKNFYWEAREWPYKNVKRCVFAEAFLNDDEIVSNHDQALNSTVVSNFGGLKDFKFFCYNGEPKVMYIGNDRCDSPTTDFFDMDFNHLPVIIKDPPAIVTPKKPELFATMKKLAALLSGNIPHVRVDFYVHDKRVLFGEMTFYHNGGFSSVKPLEWNIRMGDWITLPTNSNGLEG